MKLGLVALALVISVPTVAIAKDGIEPIRAKIVKTEIVANNKDTIVTVGAGSDHGVDQDYACTFFSESGIPLVGKCEIVRVAKRTTAIKTDLPPPKLAHASVKIGPLVR